MSLTAPKNVCLVRLSALGDVVLATALVATLRENFPSNRLTWITSPAAFDLLRGLEGVDFFVLPKPRRVGDYFAFRRAMRGLDFDVVLAAQASFRVNLVHAQIPARRKIGFDLRRARDGHRWFVTDAIPQRDEHLADGFLAFAGALGVAPENYVRRTTVPLTAEDIAAAKQLQPAGRFVVLNPAASKAERNWLAERYAAVADHIARSTGWSVLLTGGPAAEERALAEAVLAQAKTPLVNLAGRTTVRQLTALLAGAEALIAPDTGPVHLAGAVGTPVVGLYAVARSELTGPWLDRRYCVDKYAEAARQFLGASGAAPDWHQRVHHGEAMTLITVEEVCAQFDHLVADRGACER